MTQSKLKIGYKVPKIIKHWACSYCGSFVRMDDIVCNSCGCILKWNDTQPLCGPTQEMWHH
jgi:hypothetical protein